MVTRSQNVPDIRMALPGPRAAEMVAADERVTSPSYTRAYPLVVKRGEGAVIEDVDGNRFLDFTAGIAVCATGHCHPRVVAAIRQQSGELIHMSGTDFYYGPQQRLAQKLAELAPGTNSKKVFFTNSGAEAVEAAIKLARHHTGRQHLIAFHGAFHGRTMGALSLTASKSIQRDGFAPLVPGVSHITYPDPFRHPAGMTADEYGTHCARAIEDVLFRHTVPPHEVAAIIVEPIQGEGGYIVPPATFHTELKAIAQRHGILLIADEVQSGMGRTGTMFAMKQWGVEPDIICLAKGIASGMPLGAIIAGEEVMDWPPGSHASTFGGNPVCCAAALETIALLESDLMDNAARVGGMLQDGLRELQSRHSLVGDVRGRGLMIGVELVRDRQSKEPAKEESRQIVQACFLKGLLLLTCGENSIRLSPPLVISEEHARTALRILDEAFTELSTIPPIAARSGGVTETAGP